MQGIKLHPGYTFDGLKRLGIFYEYNELILMGEFGLFPKQPVPFVWNMHDILDWLEINRDNLPKKPAKA